MKYFAFLRAINVSGTNKVGMAELRTFMGDLGYSGVQTVLQTGNIVFEAEEQDSANLEQSLKAEAENRLGLKTEFFVRTMRDLESIVAQNPFPQEAIEDPSHLLVLFASQSPSPANLQRLREWIKGREYFHAIENNLYFVYPDNIGNSKLTTKVIERELGCMVTGRNWNTVLKLRALGG